MKSQIQKQQKTYVNVIAVKEGNENSEKNQSFSRCIKVRFN